MPRCSLANLKIGDGIFQLKDSGDPKAKGGLVGVDMYLICGKTKALLIDLGNNYIDGYSGDEISPRTNAAAELRAAVDGLIGPLPLEIAITHAHPDHDGMTKAFLGRKIVTWMPKGEDLEALRQQHGIDPAVYSVFDQQTQTFDLGGESVRLRPKNGSIQDPAVLYTLNGKAARIGSVPHCGRCRPDVLPLDSTRLTLPGMTWRRRTT